jgi:hypothetical protein
MADPFHRNYPQNLLDKVGPRNMLVELIESVDSRQELIRERVPGLPPDAARVDRPVACLACSSPLDKGLDESAAKGWTVASMKDDWKTIFPFGSK